MRPVACPTRRVSAWRRSACNSTRSARSRSTNGRGPRWRTSGPSAVFCQPEMANVGLTEEQARQTLGELRVYASAFTPMKYTLAGRKQRSFMKLIVEAATDRVVGCHMVGDDAAELIQGLAVAIKAGATKAQFDATVGIHPTAGEEFVTMRTARPEPAPKKAAAE